MLGAHDTSIVKGRCMQPDARHGVPETRKALRALALLVEDSACCGVYMCPHSVLMLPTKERWVAEAEKQS